MSTPRSAKRQNQGLIPAKVICHGQSKFEITVFPEDQESPHSASKIRIVTEGLLGEGAFGTVVHGKMMEEVQGQPGEYTNFKEVAVKCSRKKMRGKELDRLREEVKIMALLEHPNIVHFYLACVFHDFIYIVMEKCEKANLHDVIKEHESPMKMNDILFIGYQMVDAICYMHSKGCIHRDLKPTNFVFDRDGNIKLTDFGLSSSGNSGMIYDPSNANAKDHTKVDSRVMSHRCTVAGTYSYMAPEIMKQVILHQQNKHLEKGFRYSVEVDIYSLGVVLFYLATKTSPYWNSIRDTKSDPSAKKDSTKLLCGAVSEGRWQWPHRSKVSMEEISYEFMRLVESMLTYEGSRRPELKGIRKHHIWIDRPESISDPLMQIIRKDRVVESRQATLSRERVEYKKQCLVKLQELESVGRERIQSSRNRYEQNVAIQLKELASRFTIINTSQSILNKLLSKQHDERMQIVLDSSKHPEKLHQTDPRPRPMTDREVEVSGRYSFRASTLAAWSVDSPLATRVRKSTPKTPASQTASPLGSSQISRSSRAQRHGKSQAAQYRPTPVQRSLRSHSREVSSAKRRRTPSFWLDGPSQKFVSAPEPTFDPKKDVMKCPKKHPMSLMHTFPALNETAGGTNDYGWGFWCDQCHKEVPTLSKQKRMARLEASEDERTAAPDENTLFYHCHCGYDLCKACGAKAILKVVEDTEDSFSTRGIELSFETPQKKQKKAVKETHMNAEPQEAKQKNDAAKKDDMSFDMLDDIDQISLDLPPAEETQGRPTFAPNQPMVPFTAPSTFKRSQPLPPPHTPSSILDKRMEAMMQEDAEKKTTRLWWEATSPLHEASSPVTRELEQNGVQLPPPHKVSQDSNLFADLNIENSPKLFDTPHPPKKDAPVITQSPSLPSTREVTPLQTPKGVHYVNKIAADKDPHAANHLAEEIPEDIRSGKGWIWHYEITYENDVLYVLYMTNENSYGCLVMNPEKLEYSAVVYDKHRRSVFFIPTLKKEAKDGRIRANYNHPHPYVRTSYQDHIIMLREADVLRLSTDGEDQSPLIKPSDHLSPHERGIINDLPVHLTVLKDYVDGLRDFKLPFETSVNEPHVYLRKFFCDNSSEDDISWYMFRLSNGHAVISSPRDNMQIRWTTAQKPGEHSRTPVYIPKYKFTSQDVVLFKDPVYFRKIREVLISIDDHAHKDVYDEAQN